MGSSAGLFGVADGVTGLYTLEQGPRFFGSKTGGQLAAATLQHACIAYSGRPLAHTITHANKTLRMTLQRARPVIDLEHSEMLPSACFALAHIRDRILAQAGDCLAIWQTHDGQVAFTPNPMLEYERWMQRLRDELIAKHGDREKAMQEFFSETLVRTRRQCVNTNDPLGYAVLNGQPEFMDRIRWYELPRPEELRRILLFTDGLISVEDTARPDFGEWILNLYDEGGFGTILRGTREEEDRMASHSHELHAECTFVAWEPKA